MKERILHCFNKGAKTYDSAAIVQAEVAARLLQHLPNQTAQNILEIGCGTGQFSQMLVSRYPSANLQLTDIAPSMIDICKERLSSATSVQFICTDIETVDPIPRFDLIVSSMTLHWFTEIQKSFAKIMANLAPGGQFIFAMLGEHSLHEWKKICEEMQFAIPTPLFPAKNMLKKLFPNMKLQTEMLRHSYKNAYDFLSSLKKIGATATKKEYVSSSAGKLRNILRRFNHEIEISYEVIYGHYVRP